MPHRMTLREMARAVAGRRVSPEELLSAHRRQIERQNPRLNAFLKVFAADAPCGDGPLRGVPVTIKDSFDIAGEPTTGGSTLRREAVAREDAVCVARLRRAGAVILGKTNLPEFLLNYESDNHLIGRTNNPWDVTRTSGGSSGGESAAIASFCSAGGMGSDAGGSVRVPAAFCGIAALKPTPGRCPAYGHWPPIAHPGGLLGVAGPMARTVDDVRLLFEVIAGHDARDPFSAPVPLRRAPLEGARVAVMENLAGEEMDPELLAAVRRAAGLLRDLGIECVEFDARPLREGPALWEFFFNELAAPQVFAAIAGVEDRIHWTGTEWIAPYRGKEPPSCRRIVQALGGRDRLRSETVERMERAGTPLILAPCGGMRAWPHHLPPYENRVFARMAGVTIWNLLGFPALALPMAVPADGLPAGIQIIGAPFDEERVLELGVRLEEARGALPPPPGVG